MQNRFFINFLEKSLRYYGGVGDGESMAFSFMRA